MMENLRKNHVKSWKNNVPSLNPTVTRKLSAGPVLFKHRQVSLYYKQSRYIIYRKLNIERTSLSFKISQE